MSMTQKSKMSIPARLCVVAFTIAALILYRDYAPASLGNSAASGFSLTRSLGAGISGGIGAMLGLGLVRLFEKIRGKS